MSNLPKLNWPLLVSLLLGFLLLVSVTVNVYWLYTSVLKPSQTQDATLTYDSNLSKLKPNQDEILGTELTDLEIEVDSDDFYIIDQQLNNLNQSAIPTISNSKSNKFKVKFAKSFPFKEYNLIIYFNSSDSWLRSSLTMERQLTPDQILLRDWRVGKIVYFSKTNQFVYLMPSQTYSLEIVNLATVEEEANLKSKIDYPEYGTIEYVSCRPVSANVAKWRAVECQYEYELKNFPGHKRDNGKIVSCYLPVRGTEKDWLKFSVGIRSAGTTLNLCDLVLRDQVVLAQKQ